MFSVASHVWFCLKELLRNPLTDDSVSGSIELLHWKETARMNLITSTTKEGSMLSSFPNSRIFVCDCVASSCLSEKIHLLPTLSAS